MAAVRHPAMSLPLLIPESSDPNYLNRKIATDESGQDEVPEMAGKNKKPG